MAMVKFHPGVCHQAETSISKVDVLFCLTEKEYLLKSDILHGIFYTYTKENVVEWRTLRRHPARFPDISPGAGLSYQLTASSTDSFCMFFRFCSMVG